MEQSNAKVKVQNTSIIKDAKDPLSSKDFQNKSTSESSYVCEEKQKPFDPRLYRPLEVIVSLTIHDIQAHLMKVTRYFNF